MPYKDDEDATGTVFVVGIQALKRVLFSILVQDGQVGDFVEVSFGGWIVVDLDVAFEVGGRVFDGHAVERRSRVFSNGVNPEDEGDESEDEEDSNGGRVGEEERKRRDKGVD